MLFYIPKRLEILLVGVKMVINEKIKKIRRSQDLSQEAMAEKLGISTNSYAKLERGETELSITRLQEIANILGVEASDLLQNNHSIVFLMSENSQNSSNYYGSSVDMQLELEKLKLEISYKNKELQYKDSEIAMLKKLLAFHEDKSNNQ